jgi:hypothetical protein
MASTTSAPRTSLAKQLSASSMSAASRFCVPGPWLRVLSIVEM